MRGTQSTAVLVTNLEHLDSSPGQESHHVPSMLKSRKVLEMEREAPSLVEFYCEDDIDNMSLWGLSPNQNSSFGCEEKICQSELFLSMSSPESLSSLGEVKGK